MGRFLSLLAMLACVGCTDSSETPGPQRTILVTVHPLSLIVQEVVGTSFQVQTLLPSGVSPHAYDPIPSAVRAAHAAALILAADPSVDGWSISLASKRIWWFNPPEDEAERDPHFWLDPLAVKDSLPRLIRQLCILASEDCDGFQARSTEFSQRLDDLAARGLSVLDGHECVVSGPFMNGFAKRFGLHILDVISTVEGVEPSTRDIQRAAQAAARAGLVVSQQSLPEHASLLVSQISGARLATIDIIGSPESAPDYHSLINQILEKMGGAE